MLCWHKSIACHVIKKTFYVVFDATKNIKMYVQINSLFAVLNFRKKKIKNFSSSIQCFQLLNYGVMENLNWFM